ncbi:hypothetical protein QWJ26_04615 [Streptomyces sp. CSDS2]|nr:hypothetical protein [Streptomyces sp. CSDS2]MDN3259100.1 hypothetical protein [Streptomyces sp. CSDS2]
MSLPELLVVVLVPLVFTVVLLVAFLAALRGLRGDQRIAAFRIFVRALRR